MKIIDERYKFKDENRYERDQDENHANKMHTFNYIKEICKQKHKVYSVAQLLFSSPLIMYTFAL